MQIQPPIRYKNSLIRHKKPSEEGYMLLAVVCMLALMTIWLAVAIPDVTKSIQRDREVETMHRGKQYMRAIKLYYGKFGAYPPSIDALVNTNNIRFLRKRYIDPMTRKDDWKPVYFGQNKAPLAMGFFGEPLGGLSGATPIAGTGPSGTGGMPGQTGFGAGPTGGGSSGISPTSLFGGGSSTDNGVNTSTGSTGSTTDNSGNSGGTSGTGSTGTGSGTGFMSGQTGQTMGGAGIVGFEPASSKESILIYKKKNHYNEWEFTYSPLQDMKQMAGGNAGIGQPVGNGVSGQSPTTPTSNQGIGSSPGLGSTPTQPTPMPPDQ
jgi:type II secretory pathway pseudopilin PulG